MMLTLKPQAQPFLRPSAVALFCVFLVSSVLIGFIVPLLSGFDTYKVLIALSMIAASSVALVRLESSIAVLVLFLPFSAYKGVDGGSIGILEIISAVVCVRLLISIVIRERTIAATPFDWPIALTVLGYLISQLRTPEESRSWIALLQWTLGAGIYYVLVTALRGSINRIWIVIAALIAALAAAAIGYAQHFSGYSFAFVGSYNGTLTSVFGYYTNFANYLVAVVLMTAGLLMFWHKPERHLVLLPCLAVFLPLLVLGGSRGAWLGMVAGMGLLGFHCFRSTERWLILRCAALVLTMCVMMWFLMLVYGVEDRLWSALAGVDASFVTRIEIWTTALRIILDSPLVGVGLVGSAHAFASSGINWSILGTLPAVHHAHSLFLTAWVEGGVLGFAGVLGILLKLGQIVVGISRTGSDGVGRALQLAAIAATGGVLGQGLIEYVYREFSNVLLLFVLLALSVTPTGDGPQTLDEERSQ